MSPPTSHNIIITDPARDDLEAIANYTTIQWGEKQTKTYMDAFYETFKNIKVDPRCGRVRYGVPDHYKGVDCGKHIIFYRIDKTDIYILRILHSSMDYERHLQ